MTQKTYTFIGCITPDFLLALEKLVRICQPQKLWDTQKMQIAISNSTIAIAIYESSELIGFARVNSDGIFRAMIWDLFIHPNYLILDQMVEVIKQHPMVKKVERSYIINEDDYLNDEHLTNVGAVNSSVTMVFEHESG